MKNIISAVCSFIVIFIYAVPVFSQTPYDDIKESDMRVEEVRRLVLNSRQLPEKFRMRYGGAKGNYLSFYDRENFEMYFQYRIDRFDFDAEKKLRNLIEGQSYEVIGSFKGLYLEGRFYPVSHPDFKSLIVNKSAIIVFEYETSVPLKPEQILFGSGQIFYDPRFFLSSDFRGNLLQTFFALEIIPELKLKTWKQEISL